MKWHRLMGKLYIVGCLVGGVIALYLACTLPHDGSIIPVIILSLLWLFMTASAWVTAINKNIQSHKLFMIRSYTLTLVFVSLRLLGDLIEKLNLLWFIESSEIRDTTQEWLSWVIPFIIVELIISWLPSVKSKKKPATNL